MDFLRDDGRAIGCFANRYAVVETADGRPTEKSYGMSWWRSLAALERWAESHPTHVAIFGAAMNHRRDRPFARAARRLLRPPLYRRPADPVPDLSLSEPAGARRPGRARRRR